jgi:hypothetical protein
MIVNAYAILDAFLCLLRLGVGLLVLWIGFGVWWSWMRATPSSEQRKNLDDTGDLPRPSGFMLTPSPEQRKNLEDRCYLLFLLASFEMVLSVLSWPVFYLLLQSYVPEWPGLMCIYGVTQVGKASIDMSRFLPTLVSTLQTTKPALVFMSGAWFVLYLVNRSTRTAPLTIRVLTLVLAAGLLGVADAAAETAYLVIPKQESFNPDPCCSLVNAESSSNDRFSPVALVEESNISWLDAAYYGVNLGMLLALAVTQVRRRFSRIRLLLLCGLAVLSLAVNAVFLTEVAAPQLLHLPFHHCPYDLVSGAPESLLAVALFLAGCFAVGWACVVSLMGRRPEAEMYLPDMIGRLLHLAFLGYLGSLVMTSVELALA